MTKQSLASADMRARSKITHPQLPMTARCRTAAIYSLDMSIGSAIALGVVAILVVGFLVLLSVAWLRGTLDNLTRRSEDRKGPLESRD